MTERKTLPALELTVNVPVRVQPVRIGKAMNTQPDPAFVFTATDITAMAPTMFIERSRRRGW